MSVTTNTTAFRSTLAAPVAGEALVPAEKILNRVANGWQHWPDATAMTATLRTVEAAEQAADVEVSLADLRADLTTARLFSAAKPGAAQHAVGYTPAALRHLASFIDPAPRGLANVMADLPPTQRAPLVNHYVTTRATRPVVLRTLRPQGGTRVVTCVASEKYADVRDSAVVGLLAAYPDVRVQVSRTSTSTEIVAMRPTSAKEFRKGDAVISRVRVFNDHAKGSSIRVEGGLLRLVCTNGMTRMVEGSDDAVRHVGDPARLLRVIGAAMERAFAQSDALTNALADAFAMPFPNALPTRAEVLARVQRLGLAPETLLADALRLWDADGEALTAGDTLAGVVNAMTRAAQHAPADVAASTERAAGWLLTTGWGPIANPTPAWERQAAAVAR